MVQIDARFTRVMCNNGVYYGKVTPFIGKTPSFFLLAFRARTGHGCQHQLVRNSPAKGIKRTDDFFAVEMHSSFPFLLRIILHSYSTLSSLPLLGGAIHLFPFFSGLFCICYSKAVARQWQGIATTIPYFPGYYIVSLFVLVCALLIA